MASMKRLLERTVELLSFGNSSFFGRATTLSFFICLFKFSDSIDSLSYFEAKVFTCNKR